MSTSDRATVESELELETYGAPAIVGLARRVETELAKLGLTLAQYRLLLYVAAEPTLPSDLANRLFVKRPTITSLVDGLVERQLVERRPDPDDRRCIRHFLTAEGESVLTRSGTRVIESLKALASHLDDNDAHVAWHGLRAWAEAIGRDWRTRQ